MDLRNKEPSIAGLLGVRVARAQVVVTEAARTHVARAAQAAAAILMLVVLGYGSIVPPATAADAKKNPAASNPRSAMTGTWNRYPELDEKPKPEFPAAPPIPPPPLKPEYQPDYDARRKAVQEADARGQPLYSNYTACLPDGMPAMMMAMFPMEVLQTPGQVTIIQEAYNQVRRIYMNAELPGYEDAEPGYWGHSSGKWEGDTLVVETIGIKEDVRFRDVPHGNQMRIHERLKLLSPDMMQDEVVVTDPVYFTAPWSFKWLYKRMAGYKMNEYVCEANREYLDPETGGVRLRIGK
ncbi:MAG: hypothetical protein ABI885_02115 [Gammaproteobacteria bacterium]